MPTRKANGVMGNRFDEPSRASLGDQGAAEQLHEGAVGMLKSSRAFNVGVRPR